MRAKRSKKYRKLMHQYELAFGFREPYQVLVDSNLLNAVHSFKMDLLPALERTLQGKVKPLLTKCSLAAMMASQPVNPRTNAPYRPAQLPPPTVVPLRHCSHNDDNAPIDETECLLSLLSPSGDVRRNKEHYILATADPMVPKAAQDANVRKRKRGVDEGEVALRRARVLRGGARAIPGVPIVYVKRSVMILEPMSSLSEELRDGYESGKFRAGLSEKPVVKRSGDGEASKKTKGVKKVKGPNPLSMKKPKKRANEMDGSAKKRVPSHAEGGDERTEEGDSAPKPKRRRRHHNRGARDDGGEPADGGDVVAVE